MLKTQVIEVRVSRGFLDHIAIMATPSLDHRPRFEWMGRFGGSIQSHEPM